MSLYDELQALVGQSSGAPNVGLDPVNAPMIRHMVVALGDTNPIYVDAEAAKAAGHPDLVAPPTMLQTWQMAGLNGTGPSREGGWGKALQLLDEAGFSSTVAVNCPEAFVTAVELCPYWSVMLMVMPPRPASPPPRVALLLSSEKTRPVSVPWRT